MGRYHAAHVRGNPGSPRKQRCCYKVFLSSLAQVPLQDGDGTRKETGQRKLLYKLDQQAMYKVQTTEEFGEGLQKGSIVRLATLRWQDVETLIRACGPEGPHRLGSVDQPPMLA